MAESIGKITAHLAEPIEKISEEIISLINENIKPPNPVGAGDVFVRAMYVVSDEVNFLGGRFPAEEHSRLAALLIDSPVLVGHRKDKLPVARNFHSQLVTRDGSQWVKCYFYWLKNSEGAENLRHNIDGGIYKECSISFIYLFPECSVCGEDIRNCEHRPLQQLSSNGSRQIVHFNYRQIERVLETSLVYRGAQQNTAVTKELDLSFLNSALTQPLVITKLSDMPQSDSYLVVPNYQGLPVTVQVEQGKIAVRDSDGLLLERPTGAFEKVTSLNDFESSRAVLLGLRGKQRCSQQELESFLKNEQSPVSRLEIKLLPDSNLSQADFTISSGSSKISSIRHALVTYDQLSDAVSRLETREGCIIWPSADFLSDSPGYNYCRGAQAESKTTFEISSCEGQDHYLMRFKRNDQSYCFILKQFNLNRLKHGGRFLAEAKDNGQSTIWENARSPQAASVSGTIEKIERSEKGYLLQFSEPLSGTFAIRPVRLNNPKQYLFYLKNQNRLAAER
ncbi:MAG: hypothetical protein IH931_08435 [candidate division Zixibacteria bacterium]|nr:hypothetical protein [candidate division Zixibacteria bacterium]